MKPAITERYGTASWEGLLRGELPSLEVDILYRPKINERYGDVEFEIVDCR